MTFTCPGCGRTKDFGYSYIPPMGRSYVCACGRSHVVRPARTISPEELLNDPETTVPSDPATLDTPPALQSRPFGFVEVGPAPTEEPKIRRPLPTPPTIRSRPEGTASVTVPSARPPEPGTNTVPSRRRAANDPFAGGRDIDVGDPTTGLDLSAQTVTEAFATRPPIVTAEVPPRAAARSPRRARLRRIAWLLLWITAGAAVLGGAAAAVGWWWLDATLPSIDSIRDYRPPIVTEVFAADGTRIGKFHDEERYVVPLEEVPEHVRRAFLAAEDAQFYSHSGVDFTSIARAAFQNLRRGRTAQGASTITQQVARTFLLSREKTYRRKLSEILLARKLEKALTKDEILHRYLNQIFFGHGAYGVAAAARIHFGKEVKELSLAEGALLAGLPQAPSRYAPQTAPEEALRRRAYVLREMASRGWITEEEAAKAEAEPLVVDSLPDPTRTKAPFVTEQIRRELIERFGKEVVYREGLRVTATVDPALQRAAEEAVRAGLVRVDRRIGLRKASERVPPERIDEAATALGEIVPAIGEETEGIVDEVEADRAWVRLPGKARGVAHRLDNLWAYPVNEAEHFKERTAADLRETIAVGDLLRVTPIDPAASEGLKAIVTPAPEPGKKKPPAPDAKLVKRLKGTLPLALGQDPEVEGALLSFSLPDGRVRAMVGGSSFERSEFLRPLQAKRQVGSTFKTIVYATAIGKNLPTAKKGGPKPGAARYTPATILQDAPIVMSTSDAELPGRKPADTSDLARTLGESKADDEDWKPANAGRSFLGDTLLRTAFILSRNLATIQLANRIGLKSVLAQARKLGIESNLPEDLSLALGSASLSLIEVSRAYSAFPNGGALVQPRFLEKVVDRDGQVLLDLSAELAAAKPEPALDPRVAYVMTQLLVDVNRHGTGMAAADLRPVTGGKTGTSNDYVDAWYVGFSPRLLTGVWVGYDEIRSMGVGESGTEAALPIWIDFMRAAEPTAPADDGFPAPEGVVKLEIDRANGKLARPEQKLEEVIETWFIKGTEPTELSSPGTIEEEPNLFEIDPGLR